MGAVVVMPQALATARHITSAMQSEPRNATWSMQSLELTWQLPRLSQADETGAKGQRDGWPKDESPGLKTCIATSLCTNCMNGGCTQFTACRAAVQQEEVLQ